MVAPQIFNDHKRRSEEAQAATLERGKARSEVRLKVLDEQFLGTDNPYICGATITIADFHAAPFMALADVVGSDLSAYPSISRWLGRLKALKNWPQVNLARTLTAPEA